jgi:hypothetical protein
MGLAGWARPGLLNTPQSLRFETMNTPAASVTTPVNWFRAEGIPISPFDDARHRNEYPLMRLVARDAANKVIASSDIVLPVSDEMDCRACHASGAQAGAQPLEGWVSDPNAERDYRLNILRLHDELESLAHPAEYTAALAARGFNAAGLYANVVADGRPVLCAACHSAMPTTINGGPPGDAPDRGKLGECPPRRHPQCQRPPTVRRLPWRGLPRFGSLASQGQPRTQRPIRRWHGHAQLVSRRNRRLLHLPQRAGQRRPELQRGAGDALSAAHSHESGTISKRSSANEG